MVCHNCGREIKVVGKVLRTDECPNCDADVHCCKNCRESQAEYVREKDRANFCDHFEPNNRVPLTSRGGSQISNRDDVRKAFDNLFKK